MIFDRVICGVSTAPESLEAVRQGARLVSEGGRLLLLCIADLDAAVQAGFAAGAAAEQLAQEGEAALEAAHREVAHLRLAETRLVHGRMPGALVAEIEQEQATLVCVGTGHHSRAAGIFLGSAETTLLHDMPCAVLVSRPPAAGALFPSAVAVGIDGSDEARVAVAVVSELRRRFGPTVRAIAATKGKEVDLDAARDTLPGVDVVDEKPVEALVAASRAADLLVLGHRGLAGVKALGSVSERVAHRADCSVLVVR